MPARRALVLSGGGARGAFQVGMLLELVVRQGLDFQIIRGVSVGSLNAAFLAQADSRGGPEASQQALAERVKQLEDIWRNQIHGNSSIYSKRFAGLLRVALGGDSLYSLKPLRKLARRHLDIDAVRSSGRDFQVGTVSLVTGRYEEWGAGDPDFFERFIASSSIPAVFPFVNLRQQRDVLVDGGVRNVTPLSSAFKADPEEMYVLLTSRIQPTEEHRVPGTTAEEHEYEQWTDSFLGTRVGGFDVLKRTVELLADEVYLDDVRAAIRWNMVCEAVSEIQSAVTAGDNTPQPLLDAVNHTNRQLGRVNKRHVPMHVLAPRVWFDPHNPQPGARNPSTEFEPNLIAAAIDHGRKIAADAEQWVWPVSGGQ